MIMSKQEFLTSSGREVQTLKFLASSSNGCFRRRALPA